MQTIATCILQVVGDLKDVTAGVYSVHYNKHVKMAAVASGAKIHLCHSLFKTPPPTFITDYDKS